MEMIVFSFGSYLVNTYPNLTFIFAMIGTVVSFVSAIDALIPDEIDNGFSKKLFDLPIIKTVLGFLSRFSMLRNKKDGEP